MKNLLNWLQAIRPQFFVASIIPALIGIRLASRTVRIDPLLGVLSVIGAVVAHLATNLANDYYDYLSGVDEGGATSGSRVIQEGKIRPEDIRRWFIAAYILCVVIGIPIVLLSGWPVLIFGIAGLFLSFFYVGPPLRLEYRACGEVAVGIGMGPLIILGTYFVQTGHVDGRVFLISIPIAFLVAAILYVQSLPDVEHDRRSGKITLVAHLGAARAAWGVGVIWLLIYLFTALLLVLDVVSGRILLLYFSVPLAILMTVTSVRKRNNLLKATWEGKLMVALYLYCSIIYLISV